LANLNRIILIGRLTADPEKREALDGMAMVKFRLAVSRPQSGTDFIDVVAWRQAAELAGTTLKKGALALVDGRIQNRSFEDQSGKRRWATEVIAREVLALDGRQPAAAVAAKADSALPDWGTVAEEEVVDETDLSSDLPF
jgi:single-strand DNA-binding protein